MIEDLLIDLNSFSILLSLHYINFLKINPLRFQISVLIAVMAEHKIKSFSFD